MIEQFTKAEFEDALPRDRTGKALWECLDKMENGQYIYRVKPYDCPFSIKVWSSINSSGCSGAETGKDSIRACIEKNGSAFGGKTVRWIDRRSGWEERLTKSLRSLANQIRHIKLGCSECHEMELIPFTAQTRQNKGRPFVKCGKCGHFAWTETPDKSFIAPRLCAVS